MVKRIVTIDSAEDASHLVADAVSILGMLEDRLLAGTTDTDPPDASPIAYTLERVRHDLEGVVEWFEQQRMGRAA